MKSVVALSTSIVMTLIFASPAVAAGLPPALVAIAHCDAVLDQPNAGTMDFEIFVGLEAGDADGGLTDAPGAIVQSSAPYFGNTKFLFTMATVALNKSMRTFKANVGTALALTADLSVDQGVTVAVGQADLGARGAVPIKCKLPMLNL